MQIVTDSLSETESLAEILAGCCHVGDCIALQGELGAGKTAFARGFVNSLCQYNVEVISPTFTLVQIYEMSEGMIWHFDLYRLENVNDIYETGMEEALSEALTLIEWPEMVMHLLPESRLNVHIAYGENDNQRIITLTGNENKWSTLFDRLKHDVNAA